MGQHFVLTSDYGLCDLSSHFTNDYAVNASLDAFQGDDEVILSDGTKLPVELGKKNKCRCVQIHGWDVMEQNRSKVCDQLDCFLHTPAQPSNWATMSRAGHRITWAMNTRNFKQKWGRIVDDKVFSIRRIRSHADVL